MIMLKRFTALVLSALLLLALLAGCGGNPASTNPDSTPDTSEPPASPTQGNASDSSDDATVPDDTVTPAEETTGITFPLAEAMTFSVFSSNMNEVDDPNAMLMFQEAEKRTNVHIDWTLESTQTVQEKFALNIASGIWEDCYMTNYWQGYGGVDGAIDQEIIMDLKDLLPTYAPDYLEIANGDEDYRRQLTTDAGAMLYFLNIMYSHLEDEYQNQPSYMGYMVREDWLQKFGLTSTDIVTIDDWSNMLKLFKDNGLGSTSVMTVFDCAENRIMAAWNICNGWFQVDGTLHYGLAEDSYKDYLHLMHDWYEAGYLGSDFLSRTGWGALMDPAKYNGGYGVFIGGHNDCIDFYTMTDDPNAEVRGLTHPVLEEGQTQKINHLMNGGVGISGTNISTTCEHPEELCAWLNYWYTAEGSLLRNWGVEGITYTWKDGYDLPYFTDAILHNP